MPIYEFQCQECHEIEEHLLKLSDPAPAECSSCKGDLKKIISPIAGTSELTNTASELNTAANKAGKKYIGYSPDQKRNMTKDSHGHWHETEEKKKKA